MSESGGYKVFVELDFSRMNRQMQEVQRVFSNAQKQMQQAIPRDAMARASAMNQAVGSGNQQMQMIQKQTQNFQKMQEGIMNTAKNTLALVGIGAGIAGIFKLMMDSSPVLHSTFRLLQHSVMMIFRPIGDFVGMFLRPIVIEFYRKFVIPWNKDVSQKLGDFFDDPATALSAVITGIAGGVAAAMASRPPVIPPSGTGPAAAGRCMELCRNTVNALNRGVSSGVREGLRGVIPIPVIIGDPTDLGGQGQGDAGREGEMGRNFERAMEESLKVSDSTRIMRFLFERSEEALARGREEVEKMKQDLEASRNKTQEINKVNEGIKHLYDVFMGRTESTVERSGQTTQVVEQESGKMNQSIKQAADLTMGVHNAAGAMDEFMRQSANISSFIAGNFAKANDFMKGAADSSSKTQGEVDKTNLAIAGTAAGVFSTFQAIWEQAKAVASQIGPILTNTPALKAAEDLGMIPKQAAAQSSKSSAGSGSKSINLSGASKGSKSLASALLGSSTKYSAKFAEGGLITEPTMLFGLKSGGTGLMAERGPEHIVPQRGFSPGPIKFEMHIHNMIVHKNADVDHITATLKKDLSSFISRELQGKWSRGGKI